MCGKEKKTKKQCKQNKQWRRTNCRERGPAVELLTIN